MKLVRIYVENFRNIKFADISFSDKCNIFFGNNAEGKTNLLEAISLCIGKSFRKTKALNYIPFDNSNNDITLIKLWYQQDDLPGKENIVEYKLSGNKPSITINGFPQKNAFDLYGEMKYVVFIPEHLSLIKGVPELRRDYIDNIVMLQNKTHKHIIRDYKNAVNQRNMLFFSGQYSGDAAIDMLSVWNDIIAKQGINLTFGRIKYLTMLKNYANKLYVEISGGQEALDIFYNSSVFGKIDDITSIDFDDKSALYKIYYDRLNSELNALQYKPRIGAHSDDIIFHINEKNAREFGSQGQIRSLSLVLKLAESFLIREYNRENPVLLLDEILSELDEGRRSFVLNHFTGSQIFITSCNLGDFNEIRDARIWNVNKGHFELYS